MNYLTNYSAFSLESELLSQLQYVQLDQLARPFISPLVRDGTSQEDEIEGQPGRDRVGAKKQEATGKDKGLRMDGIVHTSVSYHLDYNTFIV